MKKVILFSTLALSAVLLAGCSDKGKASEPALYNPTSNITSASESNIESGYSTEPQHTEDWTFHYDEDLGGIVIDSCNCLKVPDGSVIREGEDDKDKDIVIPDSFEGFEGLKVLQIGGGVFERMECKSLTLPEGLLYIDRNAFRGFTVSGAFKIPQSVKSLGSKAFSEMSCEDLILPEWEEIPANAFEEIDIRSRSLTIPASVKKIGDKAFFNNQGIKNLTLNEGLEIIGENAFGTTSILERDKQTGFPKPNIEELVLPNSIKNVCGGKSSSSGECAFNFGGRYDTGGGIAKITYKGVTYNTQLLDDRMAFIDLPIMQPLES